MELNINKMNVNVTNGLFFIIGKRACGKKTLVTDILLKNISKTKTGTVVTMEPDNRLLYNGNISKEHLLNQINLICKSESLFIISNRFNILSLIVEQYPYHNSVLHSYVFLFKDNTDNLTKLKIYTKYASNFVCYPIFHRLFEELTQNYGCMVIKIEKENDKKDDPHIISERIFWYNATVSDKKYKKIILS